MAVKKTKLQQRIESGEIIEQKCWQYIRELNSASDERLDSVALIDCRRSYTYRQMFRKWERYAEVFSALNMTGAHHARVGMLSEISAGAVIAFYALNMTGASVSMLPFADVNVKERCTNLIKKERITDLVLSDTKVNPELLGWLAKSREELGLGSIIVLHVPVEGPYVALPISMYFNMIVPQLRRIPGVLFMDQLLQQYEATPISYPKGGLQDDAAIVHTSGTTSGIHKPVPLSDRGMNEAAARFLRDARFSHFEGRAVTAPMTDLSSSYMLVDSMHLPFSFGGTVVTIPLGLFNPNIYDALTNYKVNLFIATPAQLDGMDKIPARIDLSCVEFFFIGGDPVSVDKKRRFNELLRSYGAKAGITIGYGLSELAGACILSDPDREDNAIGYPLSGVTAKIYDESDGTFHDLSEGERTGVLYLSSASVSCGKLDDHAFFELEEIDGKPFYNTYDLVSVAADGSMTYAGRTNKYFVNNEGIRFDAGLVESAVGAQPGIVQCALAPEYNKMIHDTAPVLYVRTAQNAGDPVLTVRNALIGVFIRENNITKTNLPGQCVITDKLPLTELGKVDVFRIVNGEAVGTRYKIKPVRVNGALQDIILTPAMGPGTPMWSGVPEELEDMSEGIFELFQRMNPNMDFEQFARKFYYEPSGQTAAPQPQSGNYFMEGMNMFMKTLFGSIPGLTCIPGPMHGPIPGPMPGPMPGPILPPLPGPIPGPIPGPVLGFGPILGWLVPVGCAALFALGYAQGKAQQGAPAQGFGFQPVTPPVQGPGGNPPASPMQGLGCNPSVPPMQGPGGNPPAAPMQGFGFTPPAAPMQGLGCNPSAPPMQGPGSNPPAPPMQGLGCNPSTPPVQGPGCNPPAPPMQGFGCNQGSPMPGVGGAKGGPMPGVGGAPGNTQQGFDPMQAMGMMGPLFNASTSNEFYED